MTRISIDRADLSVIAHGHAGFDRNGRDIVCAALSALLCALSAFCEEAGGAVIEESGFVRVEFPIEENDYLFGGFDAVTEGLRMLADAYPDHVMIAE